MCCENLEKAGISCNLAEGSLRVGDAACGMRAGAEQGCECGGLLWVASIACKDKPRMHLHCADQTHHCPRSRSVFLHGAGFAM
jgi:hypothetical protein